MASSFKAWLLTFFVMTSSVMQAQVSITLSVKPPFTPFISDYTNPERLKDISVALFNQSGNKLRLKFKLTLKNQAKGIEISIKETVNPLNPLELDENEFKFVVLEDVSNLYGKLDQNSFNISGADIQNLILDGTIPDGIYEVCLQAFDFDAPGFSKPLSDNAPQGCFSFQVNYTDPPTDMRFNNNLLQYSFGSEVPKVGVNSLMGQNYNIQFTPPAQNLGASYEYELMIFEENVINPTRQQENSLIQAINTINPIIRKTSTVPFFTIDPGDVELDYFKNYYLLIRATDLNNKTLFKNNGYSTFKALRMIDIQPLIIPKAEFTNPTPGKIVSTREAMNIITWDLDMPLLSQTFFKNDIEVRVKIIRLNQSAIFPDDIFNSNTGELLLDKRFRHDTLSVAALLKGINITDKFGNFETNSNLRWVIAVQYSVIPGRPFTSHIQFLNDGKSQTDVEFQNDTQTTPLGNFMLTQSYPVNDDTLPFHYPPVVFALANARSTDAALFTQFNSPLEPVESFKHLKLGTDAVVNTQMNTLTNADTVLNDINKSLNDAATAQLFHGSEIDISHYLSTAATKLNQNSARFRIQVKHSINTRSVPLGNAANGKMAMLNGVLKYHAATQFLNSEPNLSFPNMDQILYLKPFKNSISWTAKVGLWNKSDNPGISIDQYAYKFHTNGFSSEELRHDMLKKGLKTGSGKFNVGMKTPKLIGSQVVERDSVRCTMNLSFLPSEMPAKLLPDMETNEAWKEFNLMSVAQQWNIEISRKKDFSVLDTVISKKIVKQYDVTKGTSAIIADLYSRVDQKITVRDTGKYYWRVTWSNVTVDSNETADKRAYYGNLGRLLAAAQLIGTDVPFDSMFFIRKNYRFSKTDSFTFNKRTRPSAVKTPAFEVVYPAPGDTIPFMYPPVVIRKNPADSAYKFALTKFNSNLEPFINHNYFIIDQQHPASIRLNKLSFDTIHGKFQLLYDQLTQSQVLGLDGSTSDISEAIINEFLALTEKKKHLQIFKANGSTLLPLGNNGKGKLNLAKLIMDRGAGRQQLSENESPPEQPNIAGLLYLNPYKKVNWNAKIAYFYPGGNPSILVDSFEKLFINNALSHNSPISTENKLGQSFLSGTFHVGMKTPEITEKLNGRSIPANKVEITFRPSPAPSRVFPPTETNEAWKQWKSLFAAQQWNIEVALNKAFDTLVYRKSKCIIDSFLMPGEQEKAIIAFYSIRKEKLRLEPGKKYFYRITWSNPTELDTNNVIHERYFKTQLDFLRNQMEYGEDMNPDAALDFFNLKRINYKFSSIDSFQVTDSVSTRDTAICGLSCTFNLTGISTTPASGHVRAGDQVAVGQFTMKVKTITENTTSKTFSGTGSIACNMFAAPFAVTFREIKINSEKRMVDGLVQAAYKSDDFITTLKSISTGNSLHDKIKNIVVSSSVAYSNSLVDEEADTVKTAVLETDPNAQKLEEVYDYFNSPMNLAIDALSGNDITLPFGLSKEVDNYPHTIAITDVSFTPTSASFNAAAIFTIDMPELRQYMGFGASGLCLTPKGIGNVANGGALELMGSVKIPMGKGYGYFTVMGRDLDTTGRFGNTGTRVMWSCKGFEGIDVKVAVDISRRVAFPVAGNKRIPGRRVKATGHGMFSSANNWLLSLDFDTTYQLTFLPGFTFANRIVALDLSNLANPQGMTFPVEYQGDRSNNWQGIFIKELSVGLPPFLIEKDTLSRLTFSGRDILIDGKGFTGNLGVDNIISMNDGTLGGWKFSLDRFGASFMNSVPVSSGFNGKIRVPLFESDISYSAVLTAQMADEKRNRSDSLGISFSITNVSQLPFDAMFARVNLAPSSKIEILGNALVPKTLRIRTNFNGDISLGADVVAGMKDIRLGTLPFEGLKFKTALFTLDSLEFKLDKLGGMDMNRLISDNPAPSGTSTPSPAPVSSGEQKAGGFPINIQDFGLNVITNRPCVFDLDRNYTGPRLGIKFKLMVNVADAMGNAIGGSCGLGLYMGIRKGTGLFAIQPIGLDVDTIRIDATLTGAVGIKGGIAFIASDPVFGNGIAGVVEAKTPVFSVGVTGMFGEINRMRYWMFGLKATITPGIPIDFSANVIYANSASGEFWYKMNRTPGSAADAAAGFQLGKSPSGASFVPDPGQLFGFGIAMGITGPPGSPLFGDLGLYAQINTQGGLDKLTLEGNMWMTNNDKTTAPVLINGNTTVDVTNQKLVGKLSALVNAGGGAVRGRKAVISGGKTFYEAGSVDLLVDFRQRNWHIKLGNPFVANSKLGFGFYAGSALLFESGGYFMMGNNLPQTLPPMDPGLVSKLQQAGITIPKQRESAANTGFVILGGVDANVPEKKIELGAFYAGLSVQFAMDGMLRPQTINCTGRNGLQGWYMTGRAYAAINGALGIHADLPFFTGDIIAAELNAGMLLDAGLMNPYYFKGQFAANYSVLGGLIEGSRRFDFELAEDDRCKPAISPRSTRFGAIVADVKPARESTNVLVGVQPTIALNFPFNKETRFIGTKMVNGKPVSVTEIIRVKYEYIRLLETNTKRNRKINVTASSDGLDLTIRPDSFLRDGQTNHTLSAKFFVERFNKATNAWEIVKRSNGRNWDTIITLPFQTELNASFQSDYVSYSTPLAGERYFKRGDHTTGKIVCNQRDIQNTFFTNTLATTEPTRSIQLMRGYNRYYGLYAKAGRPNDTVRVPLTFFSGEIQFPLLQNTDTQSLYQFRIIQERVPGSGLANTGTNLYRDINGVRLRSRTASDVVDRRLVMYSFVFKTSKFNRMSDKINQLALNTSAYNFPTSSNITVICNTSEPFEISELRSSPPMITATGTVTLQPGMAVSCSNYSQDDNTWMINDYRPRVWRAGDTLQKRRPALASPFLDRTRQLTGADLIFDEHVLSPIPNSTVAFSYDLRLADTRMLQLQGQLQQASGMMLAGVDASSLNLLADNGLTLDPVSGQISGSPLTPNPYTVNTTTTTTTTTPPIGSRLHIRYTHFRLMAADFDRLKALANDIVSSNPTGWRTGMSTKEQQLVTRVRRTDYTFRLPTSSNRFAISLHPKTNNTAPLKRLYINSTILDPIIVHQINTTFTSFSR